MKRLLLLLMIVFLNASTACVYAGNETDDPDFTIPRNTGNGNGPKSPSAQYLYVYNMGGALLFVPNFETGYMAINIEDLTDGTSYIDIIQPGETIPYTLRSTHAYSITVITEQGYVFQATP